MHKESDGIVTLKGFNQVLFLIPSRLTLCYIFSKLTVLQLNFQYTLLFILSRLTLFYYVILELN